MPVIDGGSSGSTRPRKGYATGSRPRQGWAPDEDVNDAFARQLAQKNEANERVSRRTLRPDLEMSPAARRAIESSDTLRAKERFIHETDIGNAESIRRTGIRPSRGGGAMGHEGVYAYQGGPEGRQVPEGRALIEFEADPRRISGRGTTPGSQTVALSGGRIDPADIIGAYRGGPSGLSRIYEAASGPMMLASMANALSGTFGGPTVQTPLDWAFQDMINRLYGDLGLNQGPMLA